MSKIYYDFENDRYTVDSTYALATKNTEDMYIEKWVDANGMQLNFAYTQAKKDNGINVYRNVHFWSYNFKPLYLKEIEIPSKYYEQIHRKLYGGGENE